MEDLSDQSTQSRILSVSDSPFDALQLQTDGIAELLSAFPRTQSLLRELVSRFAWWNVSPSLIDLVALMALNGQLTYPVLTQPSTASAVRIGGARSSCPVDFGLYLNYHIRPIAYLGSSVMGSFAPPDELCRQRPVDEDGQPVDPPEHFALVSVAFDIEDARGRRWPLVSEVRNESHFDEYGWKAHGAVLHRHTHQLIATISHEGKIDYPSDDPTSQLTLKEDAMALFHDFAPHGYTLDQLEALSPPYSVGPSAVERQRCTGAITRRENHSESTSSFVPSSGVAFSTSTAAPATNSNSIRLRSELVGLICLATNIANFSWSIRTRNVSMLESLQPPQIARRFNLSLLRAAFDSMTGPSQPQSIVAVGESDSLQPFASSTLPHSDSDSPTRRMIVNDESPQLQQPAPPPIRLSLSNPSHVHLYMPSDLLGLIADYAAMPLPFLPLTTEPARIIDRMKEEAAMMERAVNAAAAAAAVAVDSSASSPAASAVSKNTSATIASSTVSVSSSASACIPTPGPSPPISLTASSLSDLWCRLRSEGDALTRSIAEQIGEPNSTSKWNSRVPTYRQRRIDPSESLELFMEHDCND